MKTKSIIFILLMVGGHAAAAPLACLIEPEKVAEIGSQTVGVLQKVNVERGDLVESGQILAFMQADVERASVNVAATRARAEADLKAALAAQELMQRKLKRAKELYEQKFVSQEAVDQAEAESRIATNRVSQAQEAQRVAQQELEVSNSQLAQRSIRSPFSGVVVERYRTEGERIEREPILRIAKVDPLRVEVVMPASQFGQVKAGSQVSVSTDLPGLKDLRANVTLIDRVIDAGSNTFRVRLALPNPGRKIPAGLRCKADFTVMPASFDSTPLQGGGRMIKVSTMAESVSDTTQEAGPGIQLKMTSSSQKAKELARKSNR